MKLVVVLAREADGGYSAVLPAIAGCASQGDTRADALANISEAALGCLEVMRTEGREGPEDSLEGIAEGVRLCLDDRRADGLSMAIETEEIEVA